MDDYKPVTLDEYNQSLRDSVNAYYTHAMNDPDMTQEEAIQSTGEMAEQYLEAVEQFEEAQNGETLDDGEDLDDGNALDDGNSLDDGEDLDDGLDP